MMLVNLDDTDHDLYVKSCQIKMIKYLKLPHGPGLSQGRGGAWDHRRCGTHLTQWSFGLTFLILGLA